MRLNPNDNEVNGGFARGRKETVADTEAGHGFGRGENAYKATRGLSDPARKPIEGQGMGRPVAETTPGIGTVSTEGNAGQTSTEGDKPEGTE